MIYPLVDLINVMSLFSTCTHCPDIIYCFIENKSASVHNRLALKKNKYWDVFVLSTQNFLSFLTTLKKYLEPTPKRSQINPA